MSRIALQQFCFPQKFKIKILAQTKKAGFRQPFLSKT